MLCFNKIKIIHEKFLVLYKKLLHEVILKMLLTIKINNFIFHKNLKLVLGQKIKIFD